MSSHTDRFAAVTRWRLEIVLCALAVIGVAGFADQIFIASSPSWLKLIASSAAATGAPAALLNIAGKLGAQP